MFFSTLRCSNRLLIIPVTKRSTYSSLSSTISIPVIIRSNPFHNTGRNIFEHHLHHHQQRSAHPTILRRWSSNNLKHDKQSQQQSTTFLERFLGPKPMPPRYTLKWYAEMILLCTVFGITGSTTMVIVRPAVTDILGLEGSFRNGPWSYRICSLVIMTPIYATLLVCVGTIFGRHAYFRHFSVKMWSRFGVPPELMDKNYYKNAKNFMKW